MQTWKNQHHEPTQIKKSLNMWKNNAKLKTPQKKKIFKAKTQIFVFKKNILTLVQE